MFFRIHGTMNSFFCSANMSVVSILMIQPYIFMAIPPVFL